jgi:hypothetical protein
MKYTIIKVYFALCLLLLVGVFQTCGAADQESSANLWNSVPDSLSTCVEQLKKLLGKEKLEEIRSSSEKDLVKFHTSLGMDIRNNWLWPHPHGALAQYFFKNGVRGPDDISSIIIHNLWTDLRNEPANLDALFKRPQLFQSRMQDKVVETIELSESTSNTKLKSSKGQEFCLADFRGKILLLSIMDSDDYFTLPELRLLDSLSKKYKQKLAIVALLYKQKEPVKQQDETTELIKSSPYLIVDAEPHGFRRALRNEICAPAVFCVPANILFDRDQRMVVRFNSYQPSVEGELNDYVGRLLRGK